MSTTIIDLIGQIFGRLVVTSRGPNTRHNKAAWNVKCICGGRKTVSAANLKKGHVKSCGCLVKEARQRAGIHKRKQRPPESAPLIELFGRYRRTRRLHDREFKLTFAEFTTLVTCDCHYCGKPPSQVVFTGLKATYNNGFKYNGIDRKYNQFGYITENCVTACRACNNGKHTTPYDEYILHLDNLVKFRLANATLP